MSISRILPKIISLAPVRLPAKGTCFQALAREQPASAFLSAFQKPASIEQLPKDA